jgi:hypothetical protein
MIPNENKKIITLDVFYDLVKASFAKDKLEINGINAFLEDENSIGLNPLGGIELKIFYSDLKKAFKILSK